MPDPDVCANLGAGFPNENDLPLQKFKESMAAGLGAADSSLLQYGAAAGYESFREALAGFLSENYGATDEGAKVEACELFVTTGITVSVNDRHRCPTGGDELLSTAGTAATSRATA